MVNPRDICSYLTLIIVVLSIQSTYSEPVNRENATVVYVPISSLPEPFDDYKLPNTNLSTSGCLQFLGCIEKVPQFRKPEDPLKISPQFNIYGGDEEQLIMYQPFVNCLQDNHEDCNFYPFDLSQLQKVKFDPKLSTIIIIGGYKSHVLEPWQLKIKDLWNQLDKTNIIIISWEGGNQGLYEFAAANTKVVARQIVVLLYYLARLQDYQLTDEGFTENFHLVGHSLGAHIAGYIGQDFNGKIGRITGLDPAGPLFVSLDRRFVLDKTDAIFVDVLHTNGGSVNKVIDLAHNPTFGMEEAIGHVDYYANDGKHQPKCSSIWDYSGCSHNLVHEYYTAFLEHELYIRDDLMRQAGGNYHDCHRLFAYKSDNFNEFRNGQSFSRSCPISTLDEHDLYSKDLYNCTIPLDFVTPFAKLRQELQSTYKLNLDPANTTVNKYYFYTKDKPSFLNNHILIRVRVSKETPEEKAPKVCDVVVQIKMAGGMKTKVKLPGYQLLDEGDHYEVILPFLSPNTYSKYELARLDARDYYIEETSKLLTAIPRIFPKSIDVLGLLVGTPEPRKGIIGFLKDFLSLTSNDKPASVERHECSLNIEKVSVQPLKRLHRHIMATYSVQAMEKDHPDLLFLYNETSTLPINTVSRNIEAAKSSGKYDVAEINSRIFIDTVIVGLYDSSLDPPVISDEENSAIETEHVVEIETSSSVDAATWLRLTVMTIIMIVIFATIMLYKFLSTNGQRIQEDKTILIRSEQL